MAKYYIDTCIWRDYFENRTDRFRPLGEWALELLNKISKNKEIVLYSDIVEKELTKYYDENKIKRCIAMIPPETLIYVKLTAFQNTKARILSDRAGIPLGDARHAVLSTDNSAILITRDKHFYMIKELRFNKPEELI